MLSAALSDLFAAKPSGAYLDTASIGLVPTPVATAVADCYRELARGVRGSASWQPVVERAQQMFAEEFGVADDEIGFVASTAEAITGIARAIAWEPGDEVLVLSDEFPTVVLPWQELANGTRVVTVDPRPGDDRLGALLDGLTERTRVVAVSHVSSFTGTWVDVDVLGAACAKVGAVLVCDGAQAAGSIPVDLGAVDLYIATGYKWLLAGFGVAVVVGKRPSLASLRPLVDGTPRTDPRLTYGHLNLPGVYALDAAAAVRRMVGPEAIEHRIAELVLRIHTGLADLGVKPAADLERSAGIVSLPGIVDLSAAIERLSRDGIDVASRGGYLRISPNFYTADAEIDQLLAALRSLEQRA